MDKEKDIEELRALLFEKSNSANVEPVFTDESGEEHYLPDEAIKVLNDILENAFIPFLAEVVINNGYRLCGGGNCSNFKHYEAECKRCTDKLELQKQLEIDGVREQAVREFAEKLKLQLYTVEGIDDYQQSYVEEAIGELLNELYGGCDTCPENNNAEYNERTCPKKGECK